MANKISTGIAWVTASSIARNIVGVLQISILTRLLDKSDFGIIAVATMFTSFTQLFLDMGISAGILHFQDISKKTYSSLFWLNIFFGIILTLGLFVASPLLTEAYESEDLDSVVKILCFTIFLNGFGNQQRIVCQKNKNFKRIAIIEVLSSLITLIVALITAYVGCGVYSLAYSTLAGLTFNNITHLVCGLMKDNRLMFHFRFSETKPFLKIGVYSVGSQILDFFTRELDIIIISATLGLDFLGVYNVAKRLSLAIYRFVTPIVHKVFTPFFAEINKDVEKLKIGYLNLSKTIAAVSMPLFLLVAALSPTIMKIMFGEGFVEGANAQTVFAIMYAFNSFMGICGTLQVATGRTDLGLYWTIFSVVCTSVIFYFTSLLGITAFLCGIILRTLVEVVFIWIIQFRKMVNINFHEYCNTFILPFLISSVLTLPLYVFFYKPSLLVSIIATIVFVPVYCIILWHTSFKAVLQPVVNKYLPYEPHS